VKKIGLLTLVILVTVLLTLAFSAAAASPKAAAAVAPASPAAAAPTPMPPHPRVHDALDELRHAREHMEHADGEFHGHRAKTIEHIDAAIHEAEICMQEP
jgi:Spy/CpxP family protein refolding chaperone